MNLSTKKSRTSHCTRRGNRSFIRPNRACCRGLQHPWREFATQVSSVVQLFERKGNRYTHLCTVDVVTYGYFNKYSHIGATISGNHTASLSFVKHGYCVILVLYCRWHNIRILQSFSYIGAAISGNHTVS